MFDFSRTAAGIYSKLGTNVPYGVPTKHCYFYVDLKSNMAALASDWLTHFPLLLKNALAAGIYSKLGTNVPYGVPTKC